MSKKKMFYMIFMTMVLCIMTLGYAALQERIDVEVQADIDSTYRVEITNVQEKTTEGDARSVSAASYTNDTMTATFNVGLTATTDYIIYSITITNYSTVDVKLNNVEINKTNNNMDVVKIGITNGDIILHGGSKTFIVKIKLNTATGSEQTGTITVNTQITRLKGGTGSVVEEVYIDRLGVDYLKEIVGYKIRLITLDELNSRFGYVDYQKTENTPSWIYSTNYWTMTPESGTSVYYVKDNKIENRSIYYSYYCGVRPVINLYKKAIE